MTNKLVGIKSKRCLLLTLTSLTSFFLPAFEAKAALPAALVALIPTIIELLKGLTIFTIIIWLIGALGEIAGKIINAIAGFGNTFLTDFAVISQAWQILRDFVNIFLILILLVIAFATIFNIQKYRASDLLPKLITVALIINFSFLITTEVVNFLYIPASIFLRSIGEGISEKLADALEVQTGFAVADFIGSFVVLFVNSFILTWIAIILLIRIPMLIGLAVASPIAWLGYTVPYIEKNTWTEWWKRLLCWSLIPVGIFGLIYFAILIDKGVEEVLPKNTESLSSWWGLSLDKTIGFAITAGILLGGLWYLKKVSCGVGNFVYEWTSKALFGALGWGWGGTGIPGGAKRFWRGVKESGIRVAPGIRVGGAEARRKREEAIAGILGRPLGVALGLEAQREFKKNVEEEQEKLRRDLNEGRRIQADLPGLAGNLKTSQGAAAAILIAKNGLVSEAQAIQHIKDLDSRTLVGQEYVKALTEGNFNSFSGGAQTVRDLAVGRGAFAGLGAEFLNARQEAINYLKKERPEIMFENTDDLVAAYEVMTQRSLNEARGLIAEGKKKRVDTTMWAEYINEEKQRGRNFTTTPINRTAGSTDFDAVVRKVRTRSEEEFNRGNNDFLINQNLETYNDLAFQEALRQVFAVTPQKQADLENALGPRNVQKARIVHTI